MSNRSTYQSMTSHALQAKNRCQSFGAAHSTNIMCWSIGISRSFCRTSLRISVKMAGHHSACLGFYSFRYSLVHLLFREDGMIVVQLVSQQELMPILCKQAMMATPGSEVQVNTKAIPSPIGSSSKEDVRMSHCEVAGGSTSRTLAHLHSI